MKLSSRYKLIGKKKHAILDMPIGEVTKIFEDALCNLDSSSRLVGSLNSETGVFKIEYKVDENKRDVYENYCLIVSLKELADGCTKIEYAFVYDRFLSWYTNILSVVCFLVPLISALFIYFEFELRSLIHLIFYIPLLLISSFGLFSLFGFRENKNNVKPIIKEFEKMLISIFEEH